MFKYSKEHLDWLRDNYPSIILRDIVPAFNKHFGLDRPFNSIRACLKNHKITSGRTGYFVKGEKSWNKGKKGFMGPNHTSFKKGNLPHNHRPLWSERISKYGYIEISVPEKNPYTGFKTRFKYKHVWLWEQAHGPLPKGHAVIFKDSNIRNFDQENFELVTRATLLSMNLQGYKNQPEELKPSVLALAKLEAKAGFRTCLSRGRSVRG